jgi:AraC-like DNA-binding protein
MTPHEGAGGIRWWRPAALPEVEVIEAKRSAIMRKAFEETYVLALMIEGSAGVRYRRRVHEHRPGEFLLLEPDETHAVVRADGPMSGLVLLLARTLVTQVAREQCGHDHQVQWRRVVAPASSLSMEMQLLLKSLATFTGVEARMRLSRFVAACIAQFAEPVAPTTRAEDVAVGALARARDLLHARSSETVTLEELAQAAQCATKQRLIRNFRAAFGFTPHEYLTHLRLHRARELLKRGHDCRETAHAVGFYDQSQLNRHFVKHLGVTPGAYAHAVI